MKARLLLTGGSGFLGSILTTKLQTLFEVDVLGRSSQSSVICDLAQEIPLLPRNYEFVVHAAGKAHVTPKNEREAQDFHNVNVGGTQNLLASLERLSDLPNEIVFISSVAVYGLESGHDIDESYPLAGETPYAKSKIQAEALVEEWGKKNGLRTTILRLPLLVGPNPPGNLGAMVRAMRNNRYFSIGKASAHKSMVWAEDLANHLPASMGKGGIYNLTDGYHPCMKELELSLAKCLSANVHTVPLWLAKVLAMIGDLVGTRFPLNTCRLNKLICSLTFSDDKARKGLNWNPTPVLEKLSSGIAGTVKI